MLVIHEQVRQRFDAAKRHARRIGLTSQFAQVLNYLRTYAEHRDHPSRDDVRTKPQTRVTLHYDFAPYSFSIVWERRLADGQWYYWFTGGLIYHGPHDRGGDGGAPTFSVNLTPHDGWSIHT